jgi:hypothetical protein
MFVVVSIACGMAASAHAQGGVNLSWNDCGASGVADRTFACTSNTGTNAVVASVVPPVTKARFVGIDVIIDLISQTSPLPDWWRLDAGTGCRNTSLSFGTDFSGTPSGGAACTDYFQAQGGGGISAYTAEFAEPGDPPFPNRARILAFWALATEGQLDAGTEYYMFRMAINNAKSTGTGSCVGCADPVCIVLNLIRLAQPAGAVGGDTETFGPAPGGRDFVTWQGAGANCAAVPVKNQTWGQVKALYR